MLQNMTESDIDQMHAALFTPDWVFVDAWGQKHPWGEMRAREIQALQGPRADWIAHTITEVTVYRDTWVKAGDEWRLNSREQIGQPKQFIDKDPYSSE